MFKPFISGGKNLGWSRVEGKTFFFFGTRHATREELGRVFPQYRFSFLKQVHGHTAVLADPEKNLEADAHYTSTVGVALVAQSADCTPILLASGDTVCAIHAGWRGMAQNIIRSVHLTLPEFHPRVVALGPHILKDSFEVGRDVAAQLSAASPLARDYAHPHGDAGKVHFDLAALAREQLRHAFGERLQIDECLHDTKSDLEFHSYRRGKATTERQYSFVVLNP